MLPIEHIFLGFIPTFFFISEYNIYFAILFYFSTIFIDFDHYIYALLITKFKTIDIFKAYDFFIEFKTKSTIINPLFIFHTIEFMSVFLVLGLYFHNMYFIAVFYGLIFHLFLDFLDVIISKIKKQNIHYKKISIIYYLIKYKLLKNK